MVEVKLKQTEEALDSGVKLCHIKEEPEEVPFHTVTVKTEDDEDESSELHQRATEENREELDGTETKLTVDQRPSQSDSEEQTDDSEDYGQDQTPAKRSYAMIPPDHTPFSCSDRGTFSCSECGKSFRWKSHLKRHLSVHSEERWHKCSVCERRFKKEQTLTEHLVHVHLLCPVCKKHSETSTLRHESLLELNSHLRTHLEEATLDKSAPKPSSRSDRRPVSCADCGKRFKYKSNLQIHMLVHTGETPHQCSVCGKTWRHKQELQTHLRRHHGLMLSKNASLVKIPHSEVEHKPFSCSDCGKRFRWKSDLQRHTSVHTGERPFGCSVCGKGFSRKPHLTEHRQSVHHVCAVCETHFPDQSALSEHLATHEEDGAPEEDELRPFSCSECGREFRFRSELKRHMTFHTGERPHRCSVCDRGFSLSNDLKIHMRSHTGERPFSCSVCGKSFAQNNKLTRHHRTVHYVCPVCESGFTSKTKLQEHLRTHEEGPHTAGVQPQGRATQTRAPSYGRQASQVPLLQETLPDEMEPGSAPEDSQRREALQVLSL